MRRALFACLGMALFLTEPLIAPAAAQSVTINLNVGSSLNNGRSITCRQGENILRRRGFRNIQRVDCRGRFFVYRAWRDNSRFEIAVSAHNGRVVDMRRLGR